MPQQRQPYLLDPYTPQSPVRQQFAPIYSVGQGFAQLAGDLGEAYLKGRQQKKKEKEQEDFARKLMEVYSVATNPDLAKDAKSGAIYSAQDFGGLPTQNIDPMTWQQRGQEAQSRLASANPRLAAQYMGVMMEAAQGAQPKAKVIDEQLPGGGMGQRNPDTNELTVRVQPDPIQTPAGFKARVDQAMASRPQTTVNLPPQENEYRKKRGQDFAADARTYQEAGRGASKRLGQLSVLESSLSDPAVYQGTAGNAVNSIKRAGKTLLGLDIEGVGSAEVAQKVGAEMALALKSNLPGPMSDSDRKFLIDLPPGLSNSRDGNVRLIEYQRRVARREMEIATLARHYEAENGQLDAGFDAVAADYAERNPLFSEKDFQEVAQIAASAPQPKPTAGTEQLLREADRIAAGALGVK